jgi:hypothetical protein
VEDDTKSAVFTTEILEEKAIIIILTCSDHALCVFCLILSQKMNFKKKNRHIEAYYYLVYIVFFDPSLVEAY